MPGAKRGAEHGRARLRGILLGHGARQVGAAPGLHGVGKRAGHRDRVLRQCHGGVEQHAVVAPLHDLAGVRGAAQAGIDEQGHREALAQQLQRIRIHGAAPGAYGRSPRHHGLAAYIDETLAQHQVFGAIGQDLEAVADQLRRGIDEVQRVGLQGVVVANEFELDPGRVEHLTRHLRRGEGLLHAVAAGGVGQHGHLQRAQQLPKAAPGLGCLAALAPQGGREHGRACASHRGFEYARRRIARRAQQQAAGERFAIQHEGIGGSVGGWRFGGGHGLLHFSRPSQAQ